MDAVERPIISKVNRSSCMGKERKQAALANLRNALRLCRSGVDPMAPSRTSAASCVRPRGTIRPCAADCWSLVGAGLLRTLPVRFAHPCASC